MPRAIVVLQSFDQGFGLTDAALQPDYVAVEIIGAEFGKLATHMGEPFPQGLNGLPRNAHFSIIHTGNCLLISA
jgi:hypothetical protein